MAATVRDFMRYKMLAKLAERSKEKSRQSASSLVTIPVFVETPKQREFADAVKSGKYSYLAFGGAIRGGKSYCLLNILTALCAMFPRSRWSIVRKNLPTLRRNTVPTYERIRPSNFMGELNQSTWEYIATNGSKILVWPEGIKTDPELNRWRGHETNGFGLEEANELSEQTFYKAIERAGSWVIPPTEDEHKLAIKYGLSYAALMDVIKSDEGDVAREWIQLCMANNVRPTRQPPPLILLTFNPADNWVREKFYEPHKAGKLEAPYFYLPSRITDNPHLPKTYVESLKALPDEEYKRFVEGDWDAIVKPKQLIRSTWVLGAYEAEANEGEISEAVDVARYGDDDTVFARFSGNVLIELESYNGKSITHTSDESIKRIKNAKIKPSRYSVDSVGLGAGVADNVKSAGFAIREFIAGAKPIDRRVEDNSEPVYEDTIRDHLRKQMWQSEKILTSVIRFRNLRSQAYWEFAEKLRHGLIRIDTSRIEAKKLRLLMADLTAINYHISKDKELYIDEKDVIKTTLGRSCDYGDAVVMAAFDWPAEVARNFSSFKAIKR